MTHRIQMRLGLSSPHAMTDPALPPQLTLRSVQPTDVPSLASLMFAAYQHTIDFEEDSTVQDAAEEVNRLWAGAYGIFDPAASHVVWANGQAVSAALITRSALEKPPLLAFSMTHPDWKRHGLAKLTLKHSMAALVKQGHPFLDLVVTEGNEAAIAMYRQLGFIPLT